LRRKFYGQKRTIYTYYNLYYYAKYHHGIRKSGNRERDKGNYREIHSFPAYYSSEENRWFCYTRNGNDIYGWAIQDMPSYKVFFYINRPQIGSDWNIYGKFIDENLMKLPDRACYFTVTEEEWRDIVMNGYTDDSEYYYER